MAKVTASKYYNWTGKIRWAKSRFGGLFEPDPEYGSYKCQFYPDIKTWDSIKNSGLALEAKQDREDGLDFIMLRRPVEKVIKGENVQFGRPKVYFEEGIEPTTNIGNDSEVVVNVVVYPAGRHIGHRLESVTVTHLVEYTAQGGNDTNRKELSDEAVNSALSARDEAREEEAPKDKDNPPFEVEDDLDEAEVKTTKRKPTPFRR